MRRLAVLPFRLLLLLSLLLALSAGSSLARQADSCCDEACQGVTALCQATGCAACPAQAVLATTAASPVLATDALPLGTESAGASAPGSRVWRPPRNTGA